MRIFPLGLVLLAFFLIYEVLSDFSESMLPSKETRNRVHRTMRMSVRVGKRYGDAEFDDDGKRSNFGLTQENFLTQNQPNNVADDFFMEPKRNLRLFMRTGKRILSDNHNILTQTYPEREESVTDSNTYKDFKRSIPQFLLSPRVGKNDKTWRINSLESLQKRSGNDPKATDLWFGPRIGRSNNDADRFDDIPWGYVIVNGNRLSNLPILKTTEEQQSKEESTE